MGENSIFKLITLLPKSIVDSILSDSFNFLPIHLYYQSWLITPLGVGEI